MNSQQITIRMFVLVCLVLLMASTAQALITFVDADLTSTTINGAAPEAGVNYATAGGLDDLWWYRGRDPMNGGFVWESDAGGEEDTAPLITTFTIPAPDTYDIYGLFFVNAAGTGHFDCAFSLDGGSTYTNYNKVNAAIASASDFEGTVIVDSGGIYMLKAVIGQVTTTVADESVSVYAQGLPGVGADHRTWYDGVGYEIPEPATLAILGIGGLLALRRRR